MRNTIFCGKNGNSLISLTRLTDLVRRAHPIWKKARGEQVPSQTLWGPRLLAVEGIDRRLSNDPVYTGIALNITARKELNESRHASF